VCGTDICKCGAVWLLCKYSSKNFGFGRGGGGGVMVISLKASDYECFQIVAAMSEKYHLFISLKNYKRLFFQFTVSVRFYGN
jgi:hypothetical protein